MRLIFTLIFSFLLLACDDSRVAISSDDGGPPDVDMNVAMDGGADSSVADSSVPDLAVEDAGTDSGVDSGTDAGTDAGPAAECGNSVVEAQEACDDGNTFTEECLYGQGSCTVCSSTCNLEPGIFVGCGDGIVNGPEECDDGNILDGDGCETSCFLSAWICIDHKQDITNTNNYGDALMPEYCNNLDEIPFDGNVNPQAWMLATTIPVSIAGSLEPITLGYDIATDEMRGQAVSYVCGFSICNRWRVRARPCYHYGVKPHNECVLDIP